MAIRKNLSPNPACGANTTGWGTSATIGRVTNITGMPVTTGIQLTGDGFVRTPTVAVEAGKTYTISLYGKNNTTNFTFGRTVYVGYEQSGGGTNYPNNFQTPTFAIGEVQRITQTYTIPAGTIGVHYILDAFNGTTGTGWHFSAALGEESAALNDYFDGSFPNAVWDGTAHNSTSTLSDAPTGPIITVWNGTTEVATSSVTVWNGTSEVSASIEGVV